MKFCNACKEQKPLDQFYTHQSTADGYMCACKACMADRRRLAKISSACIQCGAEPRYTARLICQRCVADEALQRKRRVQGDEPLKRGRRKQVDGNIERIERIQSMPLEGYNPLMGRMARLSLRAAR